MEKSGMFFVIPDINIVVLEKTDIEMKKISWLSVIVLGLVVFSSLLYFRSTNDTYSNNTQTNESVTFNSTNNVSEQDSQNVEEGLRAIEDVGTDNDGPEKSKRSSLSVGSGNQIDTLDIR